MMEPVTKRRKTAGSRTDTDEDDELFLEPEELNQRRDPSYLLAQGRAKAATQLKSRFEDIFAKYERDFTGIGDEIDLATGELVVDNGHLSSMRSMKDWIVDDDDDDDDGDGDGNGDGDEDESEEGEREAETETAANDQEMPEDFDKKTLNSAHGCPRDHWRSPEPSWQSQSQSEFASKKSPTLGSLMPAQYPPTTRTQPFAPFVHASSVSADPTWQAPELPSSAFIGKPTGFNGRHYGGTTPVVTRKVLRKSVTKPDSPEADDEDDLHTALASTPGWKANRDPHDTRQSPLVNKTFPKVDSSPQDNGLNELIQDVIENIPDTPPSIRQSTLPRSRGKPSPLSQGHRIHQRTDSNLRISRKTPILENDRRALGKQRERKPKVRADSFISPKRSLSAHGEQDNQADQADQLNQSSWEESDLDSFRDITNQGIVKPAGQTLYVDIKAGNFVRKGMGTAREIPSPDTYSIDAEDQEPMIPEGLPVKSPLQRPEPKGDGIAALNTQDQEASVATELPQHPQDKFERNIIDTAFYFSDEEILFPKRLKRKTCQSGLAGHVTTASAPILRPSASTQKTVERDAGTKQESTNLAQEEASAGYQNKINIYKRAAANSPTISDQRQATRLGPDERGPNQRRSRGRPRTVSCNSLPSTSSQSQGKSVGQSSTKKTIPDQSRVFSNKENQLPSKTKHGIRSSEPVRATEEASLPVEEVSSIFISEKQPDFDTRTNESTAKLNEQRRRSVRLSSGPESATGATAKTGQTLVSSTDTEKLSSENPDHDVDLEETEQPAIETDTRATRWPRRSTAKLPTNQFDLQQDQKQTPAVPEHLPPAEPQSVQPSTPRRPRSKQAEKKTPSISTSIMSLLSDAEDDEDELSFNHSDFTPSGHHRILAHRPFPELPSTPRHSMSSTSREKRHSLHYDGRAHSSKSHKISKPPRTPRSVGSHGGGGNASHKRKHRKSLARSVVRVVRRRDSDDDREGSVLQTPGGSKRRCGVDGWKCERDFCFVCME